jgi:NhaP-type Na+/H+ or K+/H+ antiporter
LARGIPDSLGTADIGRFGGGVTRALRHWAIEGVLYMMVLGSGYGALIGFMSRKLLNIASKRYVTDDVLSSSAYL